MTEPANGGEHPRKVLAALGIHPRRSLGQNFLQDSQVARDLVAASECVPDLGIVEIGPGLGAMTRWLAECAPWVLAIEADGALAHYLTERFVAQSKVKIIHADALDVSGEYSWLRHITDSQPFQVIANLPYSCATEILFRLLAFAARIPRMAVMVQREVAERLTAEPSTKAYGRLSILPSIYYEIVSVRRLSGGSFYPAAQIESDFLLLRLRSQPLLDLSQKDFAALFDRMLAAIFGFRRKTLRNALGRMSLTKPVEWSALLADVQIDEKRRGETLSISEMERLARQILATQV